jgi:1-acyl-sn-glycerol-3-phosphate acyltransferase
MTKKFIRWLIRFILSIIARIEIYGYENLPQGGGYILASNHLGRLDPAIVYYALDREDIILPVAEKYKNHWLYGRIARAIGGTFIDRFNPDFNAVREMLRRMKNGGVLTIAPEGTRSKTEAMQEGKPGTIFFALKAGVPIVPVAISGTEDRLALANFKHFRRSLIIIHAGKPFFIKLDKSKDHEAGLREATDELMCQIAVLLPQKYWGVYAEHPRLKELLQQTSSSSG